MGVRKVRDSAYWGMPVGTPIVKGMKPVRARQKMASAVKSVTSGSSGSAPSKPRAASAAAMFAAGAGKGRLHAAGSRPQQRPSPRPGGAYAAMAAHAGSVQAARKTAAPQVRDARDFTPAEKLSAAEKMFGSDRSRWPKHAQRDAAKLTRKAAAPKPPAAGGNANVEAATTDIRAEVSRLAAARGDWVGLADLRDALGDRHSRADVDAALTQLLDEPGVRIIPIANIKALKPRDRAAAVRIGGEDNHAISIEQPGGGSPRPAAPGTASSVDLGPSKRELVAEINAGRAARDRPPMDRGELRDYFGSGISDAELDELAGASPARPAATKKTTARAKMAGAKSGLPPGLTPQGAVDQMRGMSSRTAGEELLAKASRADLVAMFDSGGWSYAKNANKSELRRSIIELLIGRRLDSDAIMRAGRS